MALAGNVVTLVAAALVGLAATPTAAAATRVLYAGDVTGHMEIYAVDPARRAPPKAFTTGGVPGCAGLLIACGAVDPHPSPDGLKLVYREQRGCSGSTLVVTVLHTRHARRLWDLTPACHPMQRLPIAWSRDSARFAFVAADGVRVARADGYNHRLVLRGRFDEVAWSRDGTLLARSGTQTHHVRGTRVVRVTRGPAGDTRSPDGRWIASTSSTGLHVVSDDGTRYRRVSTSRVATAAWSPDSRTLAYVDETGLWSFAVSTGRSRRLTTELRAGGLPLVPPDFAWSPTSDAIAYVAGTVGYWQIVTGAIRVVTLRGRTRTAVEATDTFGGRLFTVAWTRNSRRVQPAPPALIEPHVGTRTVRAPGPVAAIATDGDVVAFTSCLRTLVWRIGEASVTHTPGAPCDWDTGVNPYALAVSGDIVASATRYGSCNSVELRLALMHPRAGTVQTFDSARGSCGSPFARALDDLESSDGLMVYSVANERAETSPSGATTFVPARQAIHRVGTTGCPCPAIASSPGRLVPADVDAGRVVAYGENETWILDGDGNRLLTLPVAPLGAQLSGNTLVLLLRGQLWVYDVSTGIRLRALPLPDVPSGGRECELRCDHRTRRLVLEDVRDGLAVYMLDKWVSIVRLRDGSTSRFAGTTAKFVRSGLVYADGSRIRLVPWSELPTNVRPGVR